jgi:predicted Zn-dependent protease
VIGSLAPAVREPEFQDQRRLLFRVPPTDAFEVRPSLVVETGRTATFGPALIAREPESTSDLLAAAVKAARREASSHPNLPRLRINLGIALLQAGDALNARRELESALDADPSDLLGRRFLARAQLMSGSLDAADAAFTSILSGSPRDPEALVGRAEVAELRGDLETAVVMWRDAVLLRPEDSHLRLRYGLVLLAAQRPNEAVGELRRATRLDPRLASLHQALGTALAIAGKLQPAERSFRAALRLSPYSRDARLGLADVLIAMDRSGEALLLLQTLITRQSTDRDAVELAAWGHIRQKEFREARALLISALRLLQESADGTNEDRARLLNNLGVATLRIGNRDDAANQFRASIAQGPLRAVPYHNLLRLLLDHDEAAEGERVGEEALAAFPGDPTCRLLYVAFVVLGGQYESAERYLRGWIDAGDAPADAWAELGYVLTDGLKRPIDAVTVLQEALVRFPQSAIVANNLAYALLMADRIGDARRTLELRVLTLPEDNIAGVFLEATWGLLRLREGDLADAEGRYRAAAALARTQDRTKLGETALQKMHLEFARELLRRGDSKGASKHIRWGLERKALTPYRSDLLGLDSQR